MAKQQIQRWISFAIVGAALTAPAAWGQGGLGDDEGGGRAAFANAQRIAGTVTAAGDALTVKTETGDSYKVVVTTNTRIMKDRQPVQLATIHAGDAVGAVGVLDAPTKTMHAAILMVVDAEQAKKAREGLGKVYIVGKVTAIDDVKLTILRPDNVSQVIAVDEGTSFKRGMRGMGGGGMFGGTGGGRAAGGGGAAISGNVGTAANEGESITLADIKVGDQVAGQGALKNGVFVPTTLGVAAPGEGRRRRSGGQGGAAADSAAPGPAGASAPAQPK